MMIQPKRLGSLLSLVTLVLVLAAAARAEPAEFKLFASDGEGLESFGGSVSVSDRVAVVGASGDDDNGPGSGSAYVFRFDGTSDGTSDEAQGVHGFAPSIVKHARILQK